MHARRISPPVQAADTQTSLARTGQGKKFSLGDLINLSLFLFIIKLLINSLTLSSFFLQKEGEREKKENNFVGKT